MHTLNGMNLLHFFHKHRVILLLFCIAILVRYVTFLFFPPLSGGGHDFKLYSATAEHLLTAHNFGNNPFLAPGWSIMLSMIYALFGNGRLLLGFVQSVLGALLVVGTYLVGSHIFNPRTGLYAGILALLWPPLLLLVPTYGDHLAFYSVLFLFGIFFFFRGMREGRIVLAGTSGILLAWGALTQSIGLYIPVMLIAWLVASSIFRPQSLRSLRRASLPLLVFAILFVSPIALWAHRNVVVLHEVSPQTSAMEAPFINKRIEKDAFTPYHIQLLVLPFSPSHIAVGIEGMQKFFLIPYNLSILDASSPVSYIAIARELVSKDIRAISGREWVILGVKMLLTILHVAIVVLGLLGIALLPSETLGGLIALLLLYVLGTSIGVGSLYGDNFKSISPLAGFLVPFMPFLIVFAVALSLRIKERASLSLP